MRVLAIDPGKSGGFAWEDDYGATMCTPMMQTEGDVLDFLRSMKVSGIDTALVEQVVGFIPKSGAGAMFTFGEGYGFLKGCLMALGYRVELVRPAKWQQALSLGSKSSHGKTWKNHLKATAQRLFPNCDVTLKTADALLILNYGQTQIH